MPSLVAAQQGGTARYVYDDNGRLRAVISPAGEAAVYDYDPAGNPTGVRRIAANQITILDFSPKAGAESDRVLIVGVGFGATVAANSVAFNGTAANVIEANQNAITVAVPAAATTGSITVTSPNGTATSAAPFTISPRIRVTPETATVLVESYTQFNATPLSIPGGTSVVWSVNGVVGGNTTVGTISASGLYQAPTQAIAPIVIRAASANQPGVFGEARVAVNGDGQFAVTSISVQRGASSSPAVFAPQLSAVKGTHVASITPSSLSSGATTNITINGQNLTGATELRFLLPSGQPDANFTVSNLQVNADGTQLTASVAVTSTAALGNRIVTVTAAAGRSPSVSLGGNLIVVTQ